jgi:DNA-binding NarL/FixJ family response regulator
MEFGRKTRVLIADSHKLVADGCRQMLEPQFEVLGIVSDGRSLVREALRLKPDMVVLEVALPQLNGINAAEQIKSALPAVKLVFLTANAEVDAVAEAFRRGASAYVLKQSSAAEFLDAVSKVVRGESYVSPLIAQETIKHLLCALNHGMPARQLTPREAEVLQLLSEGMSMKQVAATLEIAMSTVAFHKYKMMGKLGINSNAGLLLYAMSRHMTARQRTWTITDATGPRLLEVS